MQPPQNPAGAYVAEDNYDAGRRDQLIAQIEAAPDALTRAVSGLADGQLDTLYRNWTVRQIVHHLADSHVNCYVRFKWALTEESPTIKAYDEGSWVALDDARRGDVAVPLALLRAVDARWVQLLRSMTGGQFARCFVHPETGLRVRLDAALSYYAWHGGHHTAQIVWLRQQRGW